MAARWKDDTTSTDNSILIGDRYWTRGDYASGAKESVNYSLEETTAVAWCFNETSATSTHPVALKRPNALGIYDMSGNVWEWVYDGIYWDNQNARGGSYDALDAFAAVGYGDVKFNKINPKPNIGFRIARNAIEKDYSVMFVDYNGTVIKIDHVGQGQTAIPPTNISRVGYTFIGWDTALEDVTMDMVVTAQYEINQYTISFETFDGSPIDTVILDYDTSLASYVPLKEGWTFGGWYLEQTFHSWMTSVPASDATMYALWQLDSMPLMIPVGEAGTFYSMPTGIYDNSGEVTVEGGYFIAATETTYELWYEVRIWAESHGYFFQNLGREGHDGMIGAAPTDAKFEPVTTVSWRDVIVWLNALSEMSGLTPVYRDHALGAMIVRDSRDANASVVDGVITWNYNGYRLPTSDRWEMAARWTNDTKLSDENVKVDERYWAKGGFASGATGHTQEEKRVVAWYDGAEGGNFTRPVAQLMPNKLGVYDMSGNVYEWVYEWRLNHQGSYRTVRGGSYTSLTSYITVAYVSFAPQDSAESYYGFRILRKP